MNISIKEEEKDSLFNIIQNMYQLDVDFLKSYADLPQAEGGPMANAANIVLKSVTIVSGFNPFKFTLAKGDGYLYNEAPKVQELIDNMK